MGDKVTRRIYSADELHRLRNTCSQPKLREAIEERGGEDADLVTEHVLRGSKSFTARSFRSRASGNSLRVPSNKENRSTNDAENTRQSSGQYASSHGTNLTAPVLGEIPANSQTLLSGPFKIRPSPTPSLKKKKAEAIVKAHGSPQHLRVTAGGRIVPSEQSPLCQPRYGYSAIKANGGLVKVAPNQPMGKAQWMQATQDGFVAQDVDGRLCQIVNGTILPLNEVDGALRLYVPAPNLNVTSHGSSFGPGAQGRLGSISNNVPPPEPPQTKQVAPPNPSITAQTTALELEYSKLEHELKDLDKTEVLHGRTMGKAAKDALVSKRRELVISLDNIRKAIKSIRTMPPPEAPTSPRAMQATKQSMSPSRNRLPPFLQQRANRPTNEVSMPPLPPPAYGQFYGMQQPPQYPGQFGFQPTPSPDKPYSHQVYGVPPAGMFVPPPPLDGSMIPSLQQFHESLAASAPGHQSAQPATQPTGEAHDSSAKLPQNDGGHSFVDLQKAGSPRNSRALDIKMPESKPANALKSMLNPMSPAYKPGKGVLQTGNDTIQGSAKSTEDRVPTPLSPLHQLRPAAAVTNTVNTTDDTISPTKKSNHMHSSSISSFQTADFFPRDTREYSTRQHAYPAEASEGKENVSPMQEQNGLARSPITPDNASRGTDQLMEELKRDTSPGFKTPAPPPSTPATQEEAAGRAAAKTEEAMHERGRQPHIGQVPDRQMDNVSPKVKRQDFGFVQEDPSQHPYGTTPSTPAAREELCVTATPHVENIDFSDASTEWIEGYRAGLARKPIASDRAGEFLDGYCAGLLKSKPSCKIGPSTGSPVKGISCRPSPANIPTRSSSRMQIDRLEPAGVRPAFETQSQSMDCLKQAVLAPQNEQPLLTPAAEAPPQLASASNNSGTWIKANQQIEALAQNRGDGLAGFPYAERNLAISKRREVLSENDVAGGTKDTSRDSGISMSSTAVSSVQHGNQEPQSVLASRNASQTGPATDPATRIASLTSIDSHLYRGWPSSRVFSNNLEFKSATSVAQAAGLASGYFAHAQFDGAPQPQRSTNINAHNHGHPAPAPPDPTPSRFREASLDGTTPPQPSNNNAATTPTTSPALPPLPSSASPARPPKDRSAKPSSAPKRKDGSPVKGASPAKAKFEHIAEKVGIKVSGSGAGAGGNPGKDGGGGGGGSGSKEGKEGVVGGEEGSPAGKRRWRDVWRGSARE